MKVRTIDKRSHWQAPGNAKGFDSFIGDNSKINSRTIGILSYIKENSLVNGFVQESIFNSEIKDYLQANYREIQNDSLVTHFYKPALFYGFIHRSKDYKLSLSIEGNLFLNSYSSKDFKQCKELIVNQLDNTIYPNIATPQVTSIKLFPFRILFKLLLDKESLHVDFIKKELVYIYDYENFKEYENSKNLDSICHSTSMANTRDKPIYDKFYTWVVNSLVDLEILTRSVDLIKINPSVIEHIRQLYDKTSYSDMFFSSTTCEVNRSIAKKRTFRDAKLIQKAKNRDSHICQVDTEHKTFITNGVGYTEGHHIIPMFQQKNYKFPLDDVNNIISLCPTCHREIHSADDKLEVLNKLYTLHVEYMKNNGIEINDLYRMYMCA